MTQTSGIVLCLAYILGLLSTVFFWGGYGILASGIGAAILFQSRLIKALPSDWRMGPKPTVWLAAGAIGLLATLYFQARIPQPAANDISKSVAGDSYQQQTVTVQGKVLSSPHLTRSQRMQFWLEANQLNEGKGKEVSGRLYVTVPLQQAIGIYPSEAISVTGFLYKLKSATTSGSFDLQAYLAKEGAFAGLKGRQVNLLAETRSKWKWWAIRQRIIRAQGRWLGSPEGPLVSAIVLGHQAVDFPYAIKDQFVQEGLAHVIVASGFKVSLILGSLLAVTRRLTQRLRFCLGTAALFIYAGLTGFHPPVLRAAVMGFGALIASVLQRKRKPLSSLLIAAILLLLINPLWIWDLGFELSFLATLGLMVTVPPLVKQLDRLPSAIASLVAVHIAAYLWTLPLLLHVFSVTAPYSIVVNLLTTPLITVISLGGILSAVAAVIWPLAGSALAWSLYYPTHILILLVQFFCQLPGNSVTISTISVLELIALYGLICSVSALLWWQRHLRLAEWIKDHAKNKGYQTLINDVLRTYVEHCKGR
ncbi:MAG: ComEC/Rec2 family competence protein [Chroococcidiopsidaceae cyanobacterium CP_BM_RX_35]|nr:ComEC/Rec2 family competence protein [Chroococcidiopsidaceae cyanobacterium CP_BM_RX_35]